MDKSVERFQRLLSVGIIAGLVTGFVALIAAVLAFFSADWVGTGACLAAAGLAFGLISNAVLRQ
jgi:uncharacterized membrane protein